jgi:hypothetical protein
MSPTTFTVEFRKGHFGRSSMETYREALNTAKRHVKIKFKNGGRRSSNGSLRVEG